MHSYKTGTIFLIVNSRAGHVPKIG